MPASFFEQPILNSPYLAPSQHHPLDKDGQPLDASPVQKRRPSELLTPVPKPRKKKKTGTDDASLFASDEANRLRLHVVRFGTSRGQ